MKLKNKVVFITGGTSGIGLELAKQLTELGSYVVVCAKNKSEVSIFKEHHKNIEAIKCNVLLEEDIKDAVKFIKKKYGKLDLLINNAAVQYRIDFLKDKDFSEKAREEINTNFLSYVEMTEKFLELFSYSKEAGILNLCSAVAYEPIPKVATYCATKSAVYSFSKSLRYQLKKKKIKVFTAFPPKVDTKLNKFSSGGKGISPNKAARKIIKGIKKNKNNIRIGLSKLLYFGYRFFPGITRKVMQNF
jgi:short-subunit dehydrogenase involved in D-alanine esterification of teichoic acids